MIQGKGPTILLSHPISNALFFLELNFFRTFLELLLNWMVITIILLVTGIIIM